jgi:mannose-6-phosphate isomerase-like protein (cupin superfamily)
VSGTLQGRIHAHSDFMKIDLEDKTVDLQPQQGYVVPKGVVHRTRAPERAVILMVETAAIVPTGDK